jgi:hypothetical protein
MNHITTRITRLLTIAALLSAAACASDITGSRQNALNANLAASLSTVPAGYGDLSSSFVGSGFADAGTGSFWLGGGRDGHFDNGALMGGGLGEHFIGAIGWGLGPHWGDRGPFGFGHRCLGTFDATTGRVTCTTITGRNFTLQRSFKFTDASGTAQPAFDTLTTNTVNEKTQVDGTLKFVADTDDDSEFDGHHHGWGVGRGPAGRLLGDTSTILNATTTITGKSDRTVGGLAPGSTKRTIDGTSQGSENTTGKTTAADFTATREASDTTSGLVIPVPSASTGPTYPTAGSVIRNMKVTATYGSQSASVTRREVITYDGSATAKVDITINGTTKHCTRPLPFGRMSCS